ncbi:MAG: sodium:proton antiporter [Alkaliphilus sp.]|nr:cation:proton antiporter subunit C [Alkaliphilus sp. AH-315-G20]MBN4067631.1 cation:proton antiporter subunit C [Alkaliphilus transvaalensis]PHS34878.1 MAG: sodium:proton antiporter [Alkaliphilus sp.]
MEITIVLGFFIIFLSIYGLCVSKNIIKSIIFLNILQGSIILLFLDLVNFKNAKVPILPGEINMMVDPLPQALMITTIVIGASVTSLLLMMSIKLFHHYGTINWKELMETE